MSTRPPPSPAGPETGGQASSGATARPAVQPGADQAQAAPAQGAPLVTARRLTYRLDGRDLLKDVALEVYPGEIVTLMGPNGAGKTTLVRLLLGVLRPSSGAVWRAPGLRVGYVPQKLGIDPALPLNTRRFIALGRRPTREAIHQALEDVAAAHLAERPLHALSGGEFQRVLLARALLGNPRLLILDEPVQGVDVGGQADLYARISRLSAARGFSVLMISHDLHVVMAATHRVLCLNGHICCSGTPTRIVHEPEFQQIFGSPPEPSLAVYPHHHDHQHDLPGPAGPPEESP